MDLKLIVGSRIKGTFRVKRALKTSTLVDGGKSELNLDVDEQPGRRVTEAFSVQGIHFATKA